MDVIVEAIDAIPQTQAGAGIRKKLAPAVRALCTMLEKTLGRNDCVLEAARDAYMKLLSLTRDPTFVAPLLVLCSFPPSKNPIFGSSCGKLLSFAISIAAPRSIELCEKSRKHPLSLSSSIATLADSCTGNDKVRLYGRMAFFRLRFKAYKEIEDRVLKKLDSTDRNNLFKSEALANTEWTKYEKRIGRL